MSTLPRVGYGSSLWVKKHIYIGILRVGYPTDIRIHRLNCHPQGREDGIGTCCSILDGEFPYRQGWSRLLIIITLRQLKRLKSSHRGYIRMRIGNHPLHHLFHVSIVNFSCSKLVYQHIKILKNINTKLFITSKLNSKVNIL